MSDDGDELVPNRLLTAAARLVEEHGYDATTVSMIAAAAGVSRRTFYRYFRSKDGLLSAFGAAVVDGAVRHLTGEAPLDALVRELGRSLESVLRDAPGSLLLRLLREQPPLAARASIWRQQWAAQLAGGLADADARDSPSFGQRVRSAAAVHTVAVAIDEWLRTPAQPVGAIIDRATAELLGAGWNGVAQ